MSEHFPVVVIGAGPAGLATSRELTRRGIQHVVLERGDDVANSWANLYDSLTLHTGKHMSALPGMRLPRRAPLFVPRAAFVEYLRNYAERFALPVRTQWDVTDVERLTTVGDHWLVRVRTPDGNAELTCRDVVVGTGIVANPRRPTIAGPRNSSALAANSCILPTIGGPTTSSESAFLWSVSAIPAVRLRASLRAPERAVAA